MVLTAKQGAKVTRACVKLSPAAFEAKRIPRPQPVAPSLQSVRGRVFTRFGSPAELQPPTKTERVSEAASTRRPCWVWMDFRAETSGRPEEAELED